MLEKHTILGERCQTPSVGRNQHLPATCLGESCVEKPADYHGSLKSGRESYPFQGCTAAAPPHNPQRPAGLLSRSSVCLMFPFALILSFRQRSLLCLTGQGGEVNAYFFNKGKR